MFNTALLKVNSIILDLFNWWGASLVAQLVKSPPPMWETWVQSLGCEDPLEKGKATHSSVLAWGIPGTVQSTGSLRVRNNWAPFTLLMRNLPKEITILHDEKIFRISQSQAMTVYMKPRHTHLCYLLLFWNGQGYQVNYFLHLKKHDLLLNSTLLSLSPLPV